MLSWQISKEVKHLQSIYKILGINTQASDLYVFLELCSLECLLTAFTSVVTLFDVSFLMLRAELKCKYTCKLFVS